MKSYSQYVAFLIAVLLTCIPAIAEDTPIEPIPELRIGDSYNMELKQYSDDTQKPECVLLIADTCTVALSKLKYQVIDNTDDITLTNSLSISITIVREVNGRQQIEGEYVINMKNGSDGSYSTVGGDKKFIAYGGLYHIVYNGLITDINSEPDEPVEPDPEISDSIGIANHGPAKVQTKKHYNLLTATIVCGAPDQDMLVHQSPDPDVVESQFSSGSAMGSYGVSETGAATYGMPIELPVNKFTPNLGISYNSQASGYGLVGYGMNISGISAITRIGKNHFYDNDYRGVTYTDDDSFALDGQRLVRTDNNSSDEVVYSVEGNPYIVVVKHGTMANTWFEVLDNAGVYYEYGKISSSKNRLDSSTITEWYVNYAVDPNNNYAIYDYEQSNLIVYPKQISYGYNSAYPASSISTVTFSYQPLTGNTRPFMIKDNQGSIDKCLKSITTATDGMVFRKYFFEYDSTSDKSAIKYTRLKSITKQNGAGELMSPVTFSWRPLPESKVSVSKLRDEIKNTDPNFKEYDSMFFSMDMNSDGVSDILKISNGSLQNIPYSYINISLSKKDTYGTISFDSPIIFKVPGLYNSSSHATGFMSPSLMDIDGDGYNDFTFVYSGQENSQNCDHFVLIYGKDVLKGRAEITYKTLPKMYKDDNPLFVIYDADGDGKEEIVSFSRKDKSNNYTGGIIEYDKYLKTDANLFELKFPSKVKSLFTGDYNNDGLVDLIFFYEGGYRIYFNNGGNDISKTFSESNQYSSSDLSHKKYISQGDFDGDGLTDFVYTDHDRFRIAKNNGNGTFTIITCQDVTFANYNIESRYNIVVCDINHDGCSDVVLTDLKYPHTIKDLDNNELVHYEKCVYWLYSDGSNLKLKAKNNKCDFKTKLANRIFTGDFDGDGVYEIANYGGRIDPLADGSADTNFYVYRSSGRAHDEGRIRYISDGIGNSVYFNYSTLADPKVYQEKTKFSYPLMSYSFPVSVVSNLRDDKTNTNYYYETLRYHSDGRGSLGFSLIEQNNTTAGVKQISEITGWDESLFVPTETVSRTIVGSDTATVVTTNAITRLKNTYISLPQKQVSTDMDGNTVTTEYTYDTALGVPSTTKTTYGDGDMYTKTHTYAYTYAGRKFVPALIDTEKKHSDDPEVDLKRVALDYDENGNITKRIDNQLSTKPLTTVMTYDAAGNVLSKNTTGSGVIPITSHYEYDDSRRYITRAYSSPASAEIVSTYDIYGNLLTETDITEADNPLTRTMTYDGWGRVLSETAPDGTVTTNEYGFGSTQQYRSFCRTTAADGSSTTKWFDSQGRETLVKTIGIGGIDVAKTTRYNEKNQVDFTESFTGKLRLTTSHTYDRRGRVLATETSQGSSVSYTYGNRMVQTNQDGRVYTTHTDAMGNVLSTADPVSTVTYSYYSNGKPKSVTTDGSTVTMEYDDWGNRTRLVDPDAGTNTYTYAADGTLLTQTDARGVTTEYVFNIIGNLIRTKIGDRSIENTYGTSGFAKHRLTSQALGGNKIDYTYDRYGRVIKQRRTVVGKGEFEYQFEYNTKGQLAKTVYPGGLEVTYTYDEHGHRTAVSADGKPVWQFTDTDGRTSHATTLGTLQRTHNVDYRGYTTFIGMKRVINTGHRYADSIRMVFDATTGNLLSRSYNRQSAQEYTYDDMDRLLTVASGGEVLLTMEYDAGGNIISKSDVGDFGYDSSRPHAVTSIANATEAIPSATQTVEFGDLGKVTQIKENDLLMTLTYGPDCERWQSHLMRNGKTVRETVYAGTYERVTRGDTISEFYYLDNGVVVMRQNGGAFKPYALFADEQGSILTVVDADGNRVFQASYDAWGRQTVATNTIGFTRGYTGHEMLPEFGIINMGGRLYDPVLGRFFSPDNYIQQPDNSQNFNRYSYCLNNPLKYTDPTGEMISTVLAMAIFNVGSNLLQVAIGQSSWNTALFNIASAAATYGIGQAFGAVGGIGRELLRAGAHGLSSGVFSLIGGGNFGSGFVSGVFASGVGSMTDGMSAVPSGIKLLTSAFAGGVGSALAGGDFIAGVVNGMRIWSLNHELHPPYQDMSPEEIQNLKPQPVIGIDMGPGNPPALSGAVCIGHSGMTFNDGAIKIADGFNTYTTLMNSYVGSWASALIDHGGNSTYGSNGRYYFHNSQSRCFYGNQHVSTVKLTDLGNSVRKYTKPLARRFNVANLGLGLYKDIRDRSNGYDTNWYNTVKAGSGWAASYSGAVYGAKLGVLIGGWIGGVGSVSGAIIGAAIGGFVCGIGANYFSDITIDYIYGK